jgi:hypothetical protein
LVHLLDIGWRMQVISVLEVPIQLCCQHLTDRRFTGARDSHDEDDHDLLSTRNCLFDKLRDCF